jgi:hypothetical protein
MFKNSKNQNLNKCIIKGKMTVSMLWVNRNHLVYTYIIYSLADVNLIISKNVKYFEISIQILSYI